MQILFGFLLLIVCMAGALAQYGYPGYYGASGMGLYGYAPQTAYAPATAGRYGMYGAGMYGGYGLGGYGLGGYGLGGYGRYGAYSGAWK